MVLPNAHPLIPYPASLRDGHGPAFRLAEDDGNVVWQIEADGAPESYEIRVTPQEAVVTASDEAGLFYARQTFAQLVSADAEGRFVRCVEISDAPRFAYRGVMLDLARHFFGVDVIKAVIDRASSLKFNHLHLHLSDDQGWRLEIASRPLLTERASGTSSLGDAGGFLTQDDFREILAYAVGHHVTVVPEFDMPGHTHAVGVAYPELTEQPALGEQIVTQAAELDQELPVHGERYLGWAVGHSSLKIHDEAAWDFVRDVLGELAEITPGPYLHIGGDEALGTLPEDFAAFIARATALVTDLGKTPIAWHEAGVADPAAGTIGQFWGATTPDPAHAAATLRFAQRGGSVILSPSDAAYLDMKPQEDFDIGLSWAGIVPLRRSYEWEPSGLIPGLAEEALLGVEAALWTETVRTPDDIDRLFFPRAAAQAEIAWSPPAGTPERSWASFSQRVGQLSRLWAARGWGVHRASDTPGATL